MQAQCQEEMVYELRETTEGVPGKIVSTRNDGIQGGRGVRDGGTSGRMDGDAWHMTDSLRKKFEAIKKAMIELI